MATRVDVDLRSVLIEVSNRSGGGKLRQILAYQQLGGGKPVALFTREFVPVARQVDYVEKSGVTLIHSSDWELLDAFVYHGVRY